MNNSNPELPAPEPSDLEWCLGTAVGSHPGTTCGTRFGPLPALFLQGWLRGGCKDTAALWRGESERGARGNGGREEPIETPVNRAKTYTNTWLKNNICICVWWVCQMSQKHEVYLCVCCVIGCACFVVVNVVLLLQCEFDQTVMFMCLFLTTLANRQCNQGKIRHEVRVKWLSV